MVFYICSYGGSSPVILGESLKKFDKVEYVHSKYPADELKFVGSNPTNYAPSLKIIKLLKNKKLMYKINKAKSIIADINPHLFNSESIPTNKLDSYKVIYVYENPINSIYSQFLNKNHLLNIHCKESDVKIEDVIDQKKDLYGIEEFFNNYTTPNPARNYKIYAIKYEEMFDHQEELSEILGIGPKGPINVVKKLEEKDTLQSLEELEAVYSELIYKKEKEALEDIYSDLIDKMEKMNWIEII